MNLYCFLFFLAAVLKFTDSCLVIRYSQPNKCSPTDPATFLFAYSNDFDYEDIQRLYSAYSQQPWAAYAYMNKTYVNPSPRFESSETGSDVLDMLERFVDTNRPNICGSLALILMKRSPNEVEI
ncbi:unnamed protein product [Caenorhabditis nigoni]